MYILLICQLPKKISNPHSNEEGLSTTLMTMMKYNSEYHYLDRFLRMVTASGKSDDGYIADEFSLYNGIDDYKLSRQTRTSNVKQKRAPAFKSHDLNST